MLVLSFQMHYFQHRQNFVSLPLSSKKSVWYQGKKSSVWSVKVRENSNKNTICQLLISTDRGVPLRSLVLNGIELINKG